MSIGDIVTPLDSAVLETKQQYKVYFKIVNHAFSELVNSIKTHNICNDLETQFFSQYCELLTYSLEAFRVKYLFDDEEKMRIDLTESGFPNYLEFRFLLNDLGLRHEFIEKLPSAESLKTEFLETLIKRKQPISDYKLHQAASIVYYNSMDKNFIFKKYVQGKIVRNNSGDIARNLVSWAFYDVSLNRPFICFLYFDVHKTSVADYTDEIYDVLEKVADRSMSLEMMAYAIDKKLSKMLPKKIKMIDLGPLHSIFAKDQLPITHSILKGIADKTMDLSNYAISITTYEIQSKGKFTEGSIFNKQHLQIWESPQVEKLLFAPHRVLQRLYGDIPEEMHLLTQEPYELPNLTI
jgi:hypothetical protein